jgi:hypothetical protein
MGQQPTLKMKEATNGAALLFFGWPFRNRALNLCGERCQMIR